jgi:hypothetical protein
MRRKCQNDLQIDHACEVCLDGRRNMTMLWSEVEIGVRLDLGHDLFSVVSHHPCEPPASLRDPNRYFSHLSCTARICLAPLNSTTPAGTGYARGLMGED